MSNIIDYLRKTKQYALENKLVVLLVGSFVMIFVLLIISHPWRTASNVPIAKPPQNTSVTPSTNLGLNNSERFSTSTDQLNDNYWSVKGGWTQDATHLISIGPDSVLTFKFSARKVLLEASVTEPHTFNTIDVYLNGKKLQEITISEAKTYTIIESTELKHSAIAELHVPSGVKMTTFTFEP